MLLRISLIIAIVAGLAAGALSHFKVAPKINELQVNNEQLTQERDTAQAGERAAKKDAREAKNRLEEANKEIATLTNDLAVVSARAEQQERRANKASQQLEVVTGERNEAQRELAAWRATSLTPDKIQEVVDSLKKVTEERDAFVAENTVLLRSNNKLQSKLNLLVDPTYRVPLPAGLQGKVVAVDPKWDFVVLNIGSQDRVLEGGEMLINRDGKLIAKVRITSVEPNRSIANIMPDWKLGEVKEGDLALH